MKIWRFPKDKRKFDSFLAGRQRSVDDAVPIVGEICEEIRTRGDEALLKYIRKFDSWQVKNASQIKVKREEIRHACASVDEDFLRSLKLAMTNIEDFHTRQKETRKSWHRERGGLIAGEKYSALEKVGVYVPGGKASYPSTVLMNVIPARVAGVGRITIATPPSREGKVSPYVLAAADMAGANEVFRMGGAQAVAAMAFGTKTVGRVDKIVGPGNPYVSAAKFVVQQKTSVGIDMLAGPTEIMIIADDKSNAGFIAADMVSQAEHGTDSVAIAVVTSERLARDVSREVRRLTGSLKRSDIIKKCLDENGIIVIVNSVSESVKIANITAPEHLELQVARPWEFMEKVTNAGAIFLGDYAPVSMGDYVAGPNHVLPTGGRARFSSPLGIDEFLKKTNFIFSDRRELRDSASAVTRLAECEGLDAHAEAVRIRLRKE